MTRDEALALVTVSGPEPHPGHPYVYMAEAIAQTGPLAGKLLYTRWSVPTLDDPKEPKMRERCVGELVKALMTDDHSHFAEAAP